ncbi:MAG: hypothetical protein OXN83_00895 [Oligoflexia bacterium]|nr:hypothetical protein [Oligoflexia bacterium]
MTVNQETIQLNKDVYSSGQIESKLWLCREIEKLFQNHKAQKIWILGGWVGLMSFLLLSRERLNIKLICSFDKDPLCKRPAELINENWVWKNRKFKAETRDCHSLDYQNPSAMGLEAPDLVINTSSEHFESAKWYDNIPKGSVVAIQSCNLQHKDHISCVHSKEELIEQLSFTKKLYSGELKFDYGEHSFSRYMLIAQK